jgi:hypothetical protein
MSGTGSGEKVLDRWDPNPPKPCHCPPLVVWPLTSVRKRKKKERNEWTDTLRNVNVFLYGAPHLGKNKINPSIQILSLSLSLSLSGSVCIRIYYYTTSITTQERV